ncbi:MAG: SDR family NAD(P)-dependent oxidoreductase [Candidatus Kariarchaeaceae archaeon]|jgi:3-oxoacyl-[acyl-carrier protein] reductase
MVEWIMIMAPGSDIGQVVTHHLLEQGKGIIGLARPNSVSFLESLNHENIHIIPCEYTDEQSVKEAYQIARSKVDRISGLIHLVGGSLVTKSVLDLDLETLQLVMRVNFESAFLAGREAASWMQETGGGNIVFFGSTTGTEPSAGKLAYGVAKAAVHNLTLSFAKEVGPHNIMTNCIAPGYVMTPRHDRELDAKADKQGVTRRSLEEKLEKKNVTGRIVTSEEILSAVDLLLTTTGIQGQLLAVDLGQVGF